MIATEASNSIIVNPAKRFGHAQRFMSGLYHHLMADRQSRTRRGARPADGRQADHADTRRFSRLQRLQFDQQDRPLALRPYGIVGAASRRNPSALAVHSLIEARLAGLAEEV